MARRENKLTLFQTMQAWMDEHNRATCAAIAIVAAASIVGLFLFVSFSGFGASADFIYNQF